MKVKKLYIYYILLVLMVLFLASGSVKNMISGFKAGVDIYEENVTQDSVSKFLELPAVFTISNISNCRVKKNVEQQVDSVRLNEGNGSNDVPFKCSFFKSDKILFSTIPSTLKVTVSNIFDCPKEIYYYAIGIYICSFLILLTYLLILLFLYILFVRFKRAISMEQIFYTPLINTMRILGFLLIIENIIEFVFMKFHTAGAEFMLSIYGYTFDSIYYNDIMLAVFGVSLLFIAQIFKIGYRMQEEQKLTI